MDKEHSALGSSHWLFGILLLWVMACPVSGVATSFRDGVLGYEGTEDTVIMYRWGNDAGGYDWWIKNYGGNGGIPIRNSYWQAMIRFKDIYGSGSNQIPLGGQIDSATMRMHMYERMEPGTFLVYPMITDVPNYGTMDGGYSTDNSVAARHRAGPYSNPALSWYGGSYVLTDALGSGNGDYDSTLGSASAEIPGASGWVEFDVTDLLKEGYVENGLLIRAGLGPGSAPGGYFNASEWGDIDYRPELVVAFTFLMPGDANGDSLVDVADLGIVGANFNVIDALRSHGNFNGDDIVDVADLGILGANWSDAVQEATQAVAVPEPATLSLIAMSVLMLGYRQRSGQ
ncbi:MAG: hypothetical protein CMJ20_10220 [Phycisphaeraceae bacterium]|nr:hypothetical protein [Phycisphaeraceae bacterium]